MSAILNSSVARCFERVLVRTYPIQCEAERNPVILTCINLPGLSKKVFHLLLIDIGTISCRNLARHHFASVY